CGARSCSISRCREDNGRPGKSRLVGTPLQLDVPEPQPRTVCAAAVGRDHVFGCRGVTLAAHLVEPQPRGIDGKLCRVVVDAETDIATIGADVVDAVRNHLAEILVL